MPLADDNLSARDQLQALREGIKAGRVEVLEVLGIKLPHVWDDLIRIAYCEKGSVRIQFNHSFIQLFGQFDCGKGRYGVLCLGYGHIIHDVSRCYG